jgi:transcriptional regulator of heat shock response
MENRRKQLPYSEYKTNGGNNRKLNQPNKFKNKISSLIKKSKETVGIDLNKTLKLMFLINHLEAHAEWLQEHFEDESNYFKTYNNLNKCKNRALNELLYATNCMEIMLNKQGKTDKRLWLVVFKVQYKELTIVNVTKFKDVENLVGRLAMEETDIDKPYTILSDENIGDRKLDRQMYFTHTLKQSLDKIDMEVDKLMKWNSLWKK